MKSSPESAPIEPEKLRPLLHEKIDHMNGRQLSLVNQVLLQVEAEELAERIGEDFERDREKGKLGRIVELIKEYRLELRQS